jgi:hypothetical protein
MFLLNESAEVNSVYKKKAPNMGRVFLEVDNLKEKQFYEMVI